MQALDTGKCILVILTPSCQKSTALLTSLEERTLMLLVYCLDKQFRRENADVVGDKPVKNDAGEMSVREDSKQKAWLEHYQKLLNVEFDWDPDNLSDKPPLEGPLILITIDMIKKAISQMKEGKSPGPIKHSGDTRLKQPVTRAPA